MITPDNSFILSNKIKYVKDSFISWTINLPKKYINLKHYFLLNLYYIKFVIKYFIKLITNNAFWYE